MTQIKEVAAAPAARCRDAVDRRPYAPAAVAAKGTPVSHLVLRELTPQRFDQAFPLARAVAPRLTLAAWRHYLLALREDGGGLLAVENQRGVLLGLAAYRLRRDLADGLCLESDPVVVFDLVGGSAVAATLAEALERRAGELGCATLHTHLLGDRIARAADPLHRAFAAQGHRAEATRLCKRLPQGTA